MDHEVRLFEGKLHQFGHFHGGSVGEFADRTCVGVDAATYRRIGDGFSGVALPFTIAVLGALFAPEELPGIDACAAVDDAVAPVTVLAALDGVGIVQLVTVDRRRVQERCGPRSEQGCCDQKEYDASCVLHLRSPPRH